MTSLLSALSERENWEAFFRYKSSLSGQEAAAGELRRFIDVGEYLPVCRAIEAGERFPLPLRSVISKMHSQKKRTVYTYPPAENMVLKMLTWMMLRRWDGLFCPALYSFRPARTAKDAIRRLTGVPGIGEMYSYKADISNYFNSIPIPLFLPVLREAVGEDTELLQFLTALLTEESVTERIDQKTAAKHSRVHGDGEAGKTESQRKEDKGIMAGTPLSAFYANLYLNDLDHYFDGLQIPYARYSDDIILFGRDRSETEAHAEYLKNYLASRGLKLNLDKEVFTAPGEKWSFLGFSYQEGVVDIAPASLTKMRGKMRRKARALRRWSDRNGVSPDKAAGAFIRVFNRKLMGEPSRDSAAAERELTWSRWFFPVINTTESLHEIDLYAQDCIRYIISGKRTKARYNVRYEDMKDLGYVSLVHRYYEDHKTDEANTADML